MRINRYLSDSGYCSRREADRLIAQGRVKINGQIAQLGQTGKKTVYVGDSEVDLTTAANAGLDCISVTWGFRDRALLVERGAKQFADTAEELLRLIQG